MFLFYGGPHHHLLLTKWTTTFHILFYLEKYLSTMYDQTYRYKTKNLHLASSTFCDLSDHALCQHHLIVHHVLGRGTELLVPFDDLIYSLQEILLRHIFPSCPDGVHTRLRAHTPDISSCEKKDINLQNTSHLVYLLVPHTHQRHPIQQHALSLRLNPPTQPKPHPHPPYLWSWGTIAPKARNVCLSRSSWCGCGS